MKYLALAGLLLFIVLTGCKDEPVKLGQETMGEFAPDDAFLEGEEHAYYGSENAWDQRFFYEQAERFYKRRGQRAMLELVKGNVDDAEEYCLGLLEKDPDDLEAMFNLAVAYAHQNKIKESMQMVEESISKGLPFARYLVGPRDILKPLTESAEFKDYALDYDIDIIHGPMVGKVTDNSASFWVRTANECKVQVRASSSSKMHMANLSDIKKSSAKSDYTAIVTMEGLKPNMVYFYEVLINGKVAGNDIPSFSTYPAKGDEKKLTVVFGGGAGYIPENERVWTIIKKHRPLACLWMGDNVYINMPEDPNGVHYYTYYRRQSRPEFRKLVASTSNYAIWDDHDAATDDVWLGPYKDKPAWKLPLLDVFKQNWINPFCGTEEWPGTYYNFTIGDVEIFMLDGRFYRTNPFADNPTMLGPNQKAWLLDALKKSTAEFKVIASPVPWSFESKVGAKDTWNGFQQERGEIFDFLAENKIDGVFLIAADRHRSDAWKIERENGYPLYEFMSSRLTNAHFHPLEEGAMFGYNEKQSFGKLIFDTKKSDPSVTYEIYNIDNEKQYSFTLTKSMLSHVK
ncbi:alkaline phosphatase D family protein [Bacteroidota bacterium]